MMRRAVANRVGLAATGLVLLAAGAYTLARRFEFVVPGRRGASVYPRDLAGWLHAHDWIWWVAGGGAVVVGLLAILWLWLTVRSQHLDVVHPDDEAPGGRTRVPSQVLADAVEEDVADMAGVHRVAVVVDGPARAPRLEVRVVAYAGTDLTALRERITTEALEAARASMDLLELPTVIALRVVRRSTRVHVD